MTDEKRLEKWLNVQGANSDEVAVGLHRIFQECDAGVTHCNSDGTLGTDVLATSPQNGQLAEFERAEVIQVKWAESKVSRGELRQFDNKHSQAEGVNKWTVVTPAGISKQANWKKIEEERHSGQIIDLIPGPIENFGHGLDSFPEKYTDPFEMEHIQRVSGREVDQMFIPYSNEQGNATGDFKYRNQPKAWIASVGVSESGNTFRVIPLDHEEQPIANTEPMITEVNDGDITLGTADFAENIHIWDQCSDYPLKARLERVDVQIDGW